MGPRSGDRGERIQDYMPRIISQMLQWGHGPETVENGDGLAEGTRTLRAYMGPRSGDRGEHRVRETAGQDRSASMGPRSGDRGEPAHAILTGTGHRRFNG